MFNYKEVKATLNHLHTVWMMFLVVTHYFGNLKSTFSMLIHFKMQLVPVVAKLDASTVFSIDNIMKCSLIANQHIGMIYEGWHSRLENRV